MRKIVIGLSLAALIAALAVPAMASHYTDVNDGYRAGDTPPGATHDAIQWADDNALTNGGWPDGTFRPSKNIGRGTNLRFLHKYHETFVAGHDHCPDGFERREVLNLVAGDVDGDPETPEQVGTVLVSDCLDPATFEELEPVPAALSELEVE